LVLEPSTKPPNTINLSLSILVKEWSSLGFGTSPVYFNFVHRFLETSNSNTSLNPSLPLIPP